MAYGTERLLKSLVGLLSLGVRKQSLRPSPPKRSFGAQGRSFASALQGSSATSKGFTLLELLVVIGLIALLGALVLPAIARSVSVGRRGACLSNLRVLQTAYLLYLGDHDGQFFPYAEDAPGTTDKLYYWGLSSREGAEGERALDMSKARLAPYLGNGGGVEVCPEMPYRAPYFKQKYKIASYGYGINMNMLANFAEAYGMSPTLGGITKPSETIVWGDAGQLNWIQVPAGMTAPVLEEWYYLTTRERSQKYHFRHAGKVNVVFADSSVRTLAPVWLQEGADGLVGNVEVNRGDNYLRTAK